MKKLFILLFFISCSSGIAQEKYITTSDGVELYVKISGKGNPCLYIHGGPGSGSYWFEKFFGEFMEQNFTVVYLDQRGVGRSGSPESGDYSIDRMSKDFEEVRQALGYEKWVTLGHSFGAILQVGYAQSHPDVHQGMMMINGTLSLNKSFCESWAPKASEFLGEKYEGCEKDTMPLMERMGNLGNRLREKDIFWKMAYTKQESQGIMDATFGEIENWNYDFGNAALSIEDYWKDYLPHTKNIIVPVLFFYGKQDYMVGPNHYKSIEFPNMIVWQNNGGHLPFQENKEDLGKAILKFKNKYLN